MKKAILFLVFCSAFHLPMIKGQSASEMEYAQLMSEVLTKLDAAKTANDLMVCRNAFELLSQKHNSQWLPVYYIAYCDIEMVYYDQGGERNTTRLEDAKRYLEKLDKDKSADASEVNTLWGYYYMALITTNPAVNGQRYYNLVYSSLNKALEQNPDNPRPIVLGLFFDNFMPEFLRPKRDIEGESAKAKALFNKEEKGVEMPYWGANYLGYINDK